MDSLSRLAGRATATAAILTVVTGPAWAQEPSTSAGQSPPMDEAATASEAMSDTVRLAQAVRYFQLGERDEARRILASLVVSPTLDTSTRQNARVYLAEILLVDGDVEGARGFLRQVLQEDPNYTIDVFQHTPEVAGELVYVKALTTPVEPPRAGPAEPTTVLVTMPLSVWSPFGRYHFAHKRPVRGLVYFSGVTASAVASGFLFGMVHGNREYAASSTLQPSIEELELRDRRRVQWVATGLFYGFWGASIIDAQVHWRRVDMKASLKPSARLLGPDAAAGQLSLEGRF